MKIKIIKVYRSISKTDELKIYNNFLDHLLSLISSKLDGMVKIKYTDLFYTFVMFALLGALGILSKGVLHLFEIPIYVPILLPLIYLVAISFYKTNKNEKDAIESKIVNMNIHSKLKERIKK